MVYFRYISDMANHDTFSLSLSSSAVILVLCQSKYARFRSEPHSAFYNRQSSPLHPNQSVTAAKGPNVSRPPSRALRFTTALLILLPAIGH